MNEPESLDKPIHLNDEEQKLGNKKDNFKENVIENFPLPSQRELAKPIGNLYQTVRNPAAKMANKRTMMQNRINKRRQRSKAAKMSRKINRRRGK